MSTELLPGFDPSGVLLSLRPVFAGLIAEGTKTIELRRRFPNLAPESLLVLYVTKPLASVVGVAQLRSITTATLPGLWRRFGRASGVSKQTFDTYFAECNVGLAIEVVNYRPLAQPLGISDLRKLWPEFSPPQSYRYVPDLILRRITALVEVGPIQILRSTSQEVAVHQDSGIGDVVATRARAGRK